MNKYNFFASTHDKFFSQAVMVSRKSERNKIEKNENLHFFSITMVHAVYV